MALIGLSKTEIERLKDLHAVTPVFSADDTYSVDGTHYRWDEDEDELVEVEQDEFRRVRYNPYLGEFSGEGYRQPLNSGSMLARSYQYLESVAVFGDSIAGSATTFAKWACSESQGAWGFRRNLGVGGDTTLDGLARFDNEDWNGVSLAIIHTGINDTDDDITPEQHNTAMRSIINKLFALGIRPVLAFIPPNSDRAEFVERANFLDFLTCLELGVLTIDPWGEFTDAATGGWKENASDDGLHPTEETERAAGEAVWAAISAGTFALPLARDNENTSGMFVNPCFVDGTTTPTGWVTFGGGTRTLTEASSVGQKFTLTHTGTTQVYCRPSTDAPVTAGKSYLLMGKVSAVAGGGQSDLRLDTPDGNQYVWLRSRSDVALRTFSYYYDCETDGDVGILLVLGAIDGAEYTDASISVEQLQLYELP